MLFWWQVQVFPIVAQLACPVKVVDIVNSGLDHIGYDFLGMDINDNECTHAFSLMLVEVGLYQFDHGTQLFV